MDLEPHTTPVGETRLSTVVIACLVVLMLVAAVASLFAGVVVLAPVILGALLVGLGAWAIFHRRYPRSRDGQLH